jgi:hypothetical protein
MIVRLLVGAIVPPPEDESGEESPAVPVTWRGPWPMFFTLSFFDLGLPGFPFSLIGLLETDILPIDGVGVMVGVAVIVTVAVAVDVWLAVGVRVTVIVAVKVGVAVVGVTVGVRVAVVVAVAVGVAVTVGVAVAVLLTVGVRVAVAVAVAVTVAVAVAVAVAVWLVVGVGVGPTVPDPLTETVKEFWAHPGQFTVTESEYDWAAPGANFTVSCWLLLGGKSNDVFPTKLNGDEGGLIVPIASLTPEFEIENAEVVLVPIGTDPKSILRGPTVITGVGVGVGVCFAVAVGLGVPVAVPVAVAVALAVGVRVAVGLVATLEWTVEVAFSSTEIESLVAFATIRSGWPSPLMSAAVTENGRLPVVKVRWVAKLGVVAPATVTLSSAETVSSVEFATTRSGLPSPLRSAAVTETGLLPAANVCWAAKLGVTAPEAIVLISTETVPSLPFATIRSGLPSPLTSAAVTDCGWVPVEKSWWGAKLGLVASGAVVLSSTETVESKKFVTIKSGLPSPVRSAAVTEVGLLPVAKVFWVAKLGVAAPGAVVLSSTETVSLSSFATIRSGMPSPVRSVAVTEVGLLPVAKAFWVAKLRVAAPGAVVLSSTETVSLSSFATIRSGTPSPLRSAAVTEIGPLPVAKVCWTAKLAVVAPGAVVLSSTETVSLS